MILSDSRSFFMIRLIFLALNPVFLLSFWAVISGSFSSIRNIFISSPLNLPTGIFPSEKGRTLHSAFQDPAFLHHPSCQHYARHRPHQCRQQRPRQGVPRLRHLGRQEVHAHVVEVGLNGTIISDQYIILNYSRYNSINRWNPHSYCILIEFCLSLIWWIEKDLYLW